MLDVSLCKNNLYYFIHLRLNGFNFLTVQGIYEERLPRRFVFFK